MKKIKFTRVSNYKLYEIFNEFYKGHDFRGDEFEIKSIETTNDGAILIFWTNDPNEFYVEKIYRS